MPQHRFKLFRVRKLTGKPVALTIADCESEARRIQLPNYATVLSLFAAESKAFRIHSDLPCRAWRIAALSCLASAGVNRAENTSPLAFAVPILGLPIFFFILFVYNNVDRNILSVYI